jgi:chemotaxis response regulator CheB
MESLIKKYSQQYSWAGIWVLLSLTIIVGCLKKSESKSDRLAEKETKHISPRLPGVNRIKQKPRKKKNMADTPLEYVPGWSADQVAQMKKSWITTAEQVVAISATTGGIRSLAEQLRVSEDKSRQLVAAARAQLAPATRAEMEKGAEVDQRGLGVLPPRNQH